MLFVYLLSILAFTSISADALRNHKAGKQSWGYVEVRPGANMFWWLYYTTGDQNYTNSPLVIWLQGGPGASSTGIGNFLEIGPLDVKLNNRTSNWVNYTNVLFIDSPVGTGYSYVNDTKLLVHNNTMIVSDLVFMLKVFLQKLPEFQNVPIYIFGESYGGKMAAQFAVSVTKQVKKGKMKCSIEGVALGDSWISPEDSVMTWGQYLYSTSLIDVEGLAKINYYGLEIKEALAAGQYANATKLFDAAETLVETCTNGVDFYNILNPMGSQGVNKKDMMERLYDRHVRKSSTDALGDLMNGPVKKSLRIIPKNVTWGGQSADVFAALAGDFMRPITYAVEFLLNNTPISVSVYNGQLDLIVDTIGTAKWVNALNWVGLKGWNEASREALLLNADTIAFKKSFKNFHFYWVLRAGHMMPQDVPKSGIKILQSICKLKE